MAFIQTKDLKFTYDEVEDGEAGKVHEVLKGVNLEIQKGEFVALLGHNGSGKSTIAKMFNAMLLPAGGKVYVEGMDTLDESLVYEIRRRVGLVLQNPDNQLVASIVEEDVAFGPENLGIAPEEIRRRVDDALKAVEMYDYRLNAPYKLSGGQKQRIAIAGVLAMRPRVIVFDEATAMLDPVGRLSVMEVVKRLNREEGITVVWITHFMEEAAQADRLLVMDAGRIQMEGTPRQVFTQGDKVRALGLDVPQMTELGERLRKDGLDLPQGILNVEEMVVELCRLKSKT